MPLRIPGLSPQESDDFRAAMKEPGAKTGVRVTVLNLDHKPLRQLTHEVDGTMLGGQVRWNTNADVHTEATVIFSDFDDQLTLDLRHLLRVEMGVRAFGDMLWCPVITGWVRACNDTGHETEVVVHDKSAFGLHSTRRGHAKKGERVAAVIRRMHRQIGEDHFNIPDHLLESGPKLADDVHWGGGKPEKSVTRMSRRLAKRAGLQVFYDQLGRLTVRRAPGEPAASWVEPGRRDVAEDVDLRLLEPITWAVDYTGVRNRVVGRGKRTLTAVAVTKAGYSFSPQKLERGGEQLALTHRFTDDTIDKHGELKDVTEGMVRRLSTERSAVRITSTPGPWLVPLDRLHAAKRDGRATDFWMGEGSLDLDGSSMAIGYQQVMRRRANTRVRSSGRARAPRGGRDGRDGRRGNR